jgi:hypothetical protein
VLVVVLVDVEVEVEVDDSVVVADEAVVEVVAFNLPTTEYELFELPAFAIVEDVEVSAGLAIVALDVEVLFWWSPIGVFAPPVIWPEPAPTLCYLPSLNHTLDLYTKSISC